MISCAFVNGGTEELFTTSPYIALQEFMVESEIQIHDMIEDFMNLSAEYTAEAAINGDDPEKTLMLESEGKNIFAKIGDKIIELWKRVVDYIKGCVQKISDKVFDSKSDLDKLEVLCKKHPELRDEIIDAYKDGSLSVASMKSFAELERTYSELVTMSKKADVKPGSMKEKWNKAVEAFEKADKTPVFVIASTIVSAMSLYKAISSFKGDCLKIKNNVKDYEKKANEHTQELYKTIEILKKKDGAGNAIVTDEMAKAEVLYRASKYLAGEYSAASGTSVKAIDKISNTFFRLNSKLTTKAQKNQFHSDVKNTNSKAKEQERRAAEAKRKLDVDLKKKYPDPAKPKSGRGGRGGTP